jgi:hypothetical protein
MTQLFVIDRITFGRIFIFEKANPESQIPVYNYYNVKMV